MPFLALEMESFPLERLRYVVIIALFALLIQITDKEGQQGALLVSIPHDRLLSTQMVLNNSYLRNIVAKSFSNPIDGSVLSAMQVLAFGLLYFKFNPAIDSFWTLYIDSMPKTYDSLIFWSPTAIQLLGAPEWAARIAKRLAKISSLHAHALATFRAYATETVEWLDKVSEGEFRWAYASIMSRSVFVKNSSRDFALQKDIAALPPFLDYFNHSNDTECEAGYNAATNCYELRTKRDWKPGQQVFIKYGAHSNATLLMHYGFAIENSLNDSIRLDINFDSVIGATKFAEEKLTKLHEMNLISPTFLAPGSRRIKHELTIDGLGWNTMVAIKTMLIETKDELKNWDRLLDDEAISSTNEAHYKQYCATLYGEMLSHIQEADALTSDGVPNFHVEMASLFRSGRRSILESALKALD